MFLGVGKSLKSDESLKILSPAGIPVTGFPSILKGYHNPLIDGSQYVLVSIRQEIGLLMARPIINKGKYQRNRWNACNRYTWRLHD